ncbi:hypothetical protein TIFTF001_056106 [Ficus carica]|uniref:Bulb-type lectin domain-containing protein n=2 Tax=Ficus carica TaxID=3494 RepID=A0AA88JGA0_FICCA|nr:hypothetical protein TIFTF001_056103 [Ficus carica]GMN73470.1 hypothetical protein TIFTF001_056104 [Ficus carica]GMN73474.1 hypothetical protein TIFTF001_056105 [Ficus carica]GMN73477.1 hypothetical protein TIFTF001_056106 [Ficus carica]
MRDSVVIFSAKAATYNTSAVLLDSGNLVLHQPSPDGFSVLWQSFEYPTDTLLPRRKLRFDSETGISRTLTS